MVVYTSAGGAPKKVAILGGGDRMAVCEVLKYPDLLPGVRGSSALAELTGLATKPAAFARLHVAHSDLSGYSIFEEAFIHGHRAGWAVA